MQTTTTNLLRIIDFFLYFQRLTTFFTVSLSLFVGGTIFISLFGSSWHVGKSSIISSYRAFTKEKIVADLGVYIGLNHVNVTLQGNNYHHTQQSNFEKTIFF